MDVSRTFDALKPDPSTNICNLFTNFNSKLFHCFVLIHYSKKTKQLGNLLVKLVKYLNPNLVRTPSDAHIFLHHLSHFDKKKLEKHLPRPGFEPATLELEGECDNH